MAWASCSSCCRTRWQDPLEVSDINAVSVCDQDHDPAFTSQRRAGSLKDLASGLFNRGTSRGTSNEACGGDAVEAPSDLAGRRQTDESDSSEVSRTTSVSSGFNVVSILPRLSRQVQDFRSRMVNIAPPSKAEVDRRVTIDRAYDFYDPVVRKVRARKMFGDTLHVRKDTMADRKLDPIDDDASEVSRSSSICSSSRGSVGSRSSVRSGSVRQTLSTIQSSRGINGKIKKSNKEVMVTWSVLVATMLHYCMTDLKKVLQKATMQRLATPADTGSIVLNSIKTRAAIVIRQAQDLATREMSRGEDRRDGEWSEQGMLRSLFGYEYLDTIMLLVNNAQKIVASQPTLVHAKAPCRVFGDIHGQFRDLLMLMHAYGFPTEDGPQFVFNGDFVDRGAHQIAVIGLLFALKVAFPSQVWLLRGNHEMRAMNEKYGFLDSCIDSLGIDFGLKVFELAQKVFDQLPVACVVGERVLVVHGGIGDGQWMLSDLATVKRPLTQDKIAEPDNAWIMNLLWSDPIEDSEGLKQDLFGVHESPRGNNGILQFAWNITRNFCARNGLSLIVRSHQSKAGSLGFEVMHDNMLIRVFSARDYEGHGNDGATLLLKPVLLDEGSQILRVRAQVVRSVTKQRHEELIKRMGSTEVADQQSSDKAHEKAVKARRKRREAIRKGASESDSRWMRRDSAASKNPAPAG